MENEYRPRGSGRALADAEGLRDAPQIPKIALEKACNRGMTFKDTQGHHSYKGYISLPPIVACYLSKVANFNLLHLIWRPVGVTMFDFHRDLWRQESRIHGISSGFVCMMLCFSRFDAILACYRQTDGQTDT